ncbi:MAG: ATP--cobalamin adenosyltransferase [Candidatus Berkelbacteria bacterium Licking1014_7]|uniref:Corrinoid adenosyltransferase n=1 Tax=Candidatus Berkelbacteria bacterium Licking1014_7 TaxID=2017147 RepID=A0A554LJT8_9BACT|nr:MAG: ATP--cobalamin adenosyltransferase [Candidatus Berkelbacteria bacterium Licking1014_7]
MTIYTKNGDQGETKLCDGLEIGKDDLRIEVIGSIDELNSFLGIVKTTQQIPSKIIDNIEIIQRDIMQISSRVAKFNGSKPNKNRTQEMEEVIDAIWQEVPKLNQFLIPGKNEISARLHYCRALARKVERNLVKMSKEEGIDSDFIKYFNRLSDLLFSFAYRCEQKIEDRGEGRVFTNER